MTIFGLVGMAATPKRSYRRAVEDHAAPFGHREEDFVDLAVATHQLVPDPGHDFRRSSLYYCTSRAAENSEVLPEASVAVAVTNSPVVSAVGAKE